MKEYLSAEERLLLKLLYKALHKKNIDNIPLKQDHWEKLFAIADKHAVLPLLYDVLNDVDLPGNLKQRLEQISVRTVQQSYRLAFLTRALTSLFQDNGLFCIALKGVCASATYPVPELRKSGDVDLLINSDKLEEATQLLIKNGFTKSKEQHANHHVAFVSPENIEVELHTMVVEPFDNEAINRYLRESIGEYKSHCQLKDVMGVKINTLEDGFFAFQLLLHMLQHFLRAGFGLKLLCDWVVFWNGSVSEKSKEDYLRLVKESGLKGFSDVITAVCVYELGLNENNICFMFKETKIPDKAISQEFVREILEAEEFGHSTNERMVVLRGTSVFDYIREFHHQMQLNFPKAGRIIICWPVTWIITLIKFLINNKKVRNTSARQILKKAHMRSKLMENMNLFKAEN